MTTSTRLYANNAKTTLASTVQPTDTTIQVANAALFPNPGPGQWFHVTIDTGSTQEVIKVTGVSGNTFTGCLRGQENTIAGTYQAATRIELRVTAGDYASFARLQDRVAPIVSLDALSSPSQSDSNSYITTSTDDGGNAILAYTNLTSGIWNFTNYPTSLTSGTLTSPGTSTTVTIANASSLLSQVIPGKYVIQFITGANAGLVRAITSVTGNVISWATQLPTAPSNSDGYQIYQSEFSVITSLSTAANSGLIYAILLGS